MIRRALLIAAVVLFAANAEAQAPARFKPPPPPPAEPVPSPPEATATIETELGNIVIRLESKKAPRSVDNFIKYVKGGFFDNMQIYRVRPDFLIQMGDVVADGGVRSPAFPPVKLETDNGLRHGLGTVSLAHADGRPNSGANTWYIDLGPNVTLNPKPGAPPNTTGYAVFARVISGLEVAQAIAARPRKPKGATSAQGFPGEEPVKPVIVKRVTLKIAGPAAAAAPKPPAPKP